MRTEVLVERVMRIRAALREQFVDVEKWADNAITEQIISNYVVAACTHELTCDTITVDCYDAGKV